MLDLLRGASWRIRCAKTAAGVCSKEEALHDALVVARAISGMDPRKVPRAIMSDPCLAVYRPDGSSIGSG